MPSTYSPDLRIELIANGEQSGTWGTTTNSNLGTLIEDAIAGLASVSVTTANQALTALNGAADQARCAAVSLSTTTTANFAVYAPPVTKLYVVKNTSAYEATIYCSTVIGNTTAAGTGIAIPAGKTVLVRSDGTNVVDQFDYIKGNLQIGGTLTLSSALPVVSGGTGATTLTANNVLLGNGTSAVQVVAPGTSGNVLTSNGTTWASSALPAGFVTGMIMMWSGSIATIPSGWALCNGSSGTPDLRNRFIIGAHSDDAGVAKTTITGSPTQTGGSKDAITVSHTHTASSAAHQHATIGYNGTGNIPYGTIAGPSMGLWSPGGNGGTHVLSSSTAASVTVDSAGSSGTNANLVPYFALAYIMKL
jgi:hypothetical protein